MKINLIVVILFVTMAVISSEKNGFEKFNRVQKKSLRTLSMISNKLWDLEEAYESRRRVNEEMKRKELEIKNRAMLKEWNERRRIFQLHLGSRHFSNVHKYFHTNRFF